RTLMQSRSSRIHWPESSLRSKTAKSPPALFGAQQTTSFHRTVRTISIVRSVTQSACAVWRAQNYFSRKRCRSLSPKKPGNCGRSNFVGRTLHTLGDRPKETCSVRDLCYEVFGDCLAHVGKRFAHAELRSRAASGRIRKNRDIFTGMIRRFPARVGVAAVVGG